MRQLADLLVVCILITVVVATVYFTPKVAEYMSVESRAQQDGWSSRNVIQIPPIVHHDHRQAVGSYPHLPQRQ
jgi:hypothetical protein